MLAGWTARLPTSWLMSIFSKKSRASSFFVLMPSSIFFCSTSPSCDGNESKLSASAVCSSASASCSVARCNKYSDV